jgi:hypothetical protein
MIAEVAVTRAAGCSSNLGLLASTEQAYHDIRLGFIRGTPVDNERFRPRNHLWEAVR